MEKFGVYSLRDSLSLSLTLNNFNAIEVYYLADLISLGSEGPEQSSVRRVLFSLLFFRSNSDSFTVTVNDGLSDLSFEGKGDAVWHKFMVQNVMPAFPPKCVTGDHPRHSSEPSPPPHGYQRRKVRN